MNFSSQRTSFYTPLNIRQIKAQNHGNTLVCDRNGHIQGNKRATEPQKEINIIQPVFTQAVLENSPLATLHPTKSQTTWEGPARRDCEFNLIFFFFLKKKAQARAGKMTWWLKALASLPGNPSLVLSTHMAAHNHRI